MEDKKLYYCRNCKKVCAATPLNVISSKSRCPSCNENKLVIMDIPVEEWKSYSAEKKEQVKESFFDEKRKIEARRIKNAFDGRYQQYEYTVTSIDEMIGGSVLTGKLEELLNEYAQNGWELDKIYNNELGKNSVVGINTTKCQHILIFRREYNQ